LAEINELEMEITAGLAELEAIIDCVWQLKSATFGVEKVQHQHRHQQLNY